MQINPTYHIPTIFLPVRAFFRWCIAALGMRSYLQYSSTVLLSIHYDSSVVESME
jgi:hypothetical protein